jgi:excisionase family DNA binding protein
MEALLTVAEVANSLRLHPLTVRNLIWRGIIPHIRLGRSIRVKQSDLEAILQTKQTYPQTKIQQKADLAETFREIIRGLMLSGKLRVVPKATVICDPHLEADILGFSDDDWYYLIASRGYDVITRVYGGQLALTRQVLYRALLGRDAIVKANDRTTHVIKYGDRVYRVLKVKRSFMDCEQQL